MAFTNRIEISGKDILHQTKLTAGTYLNYAVSEIDERFGKGYSEKNPALVASFIQVCAIDFATSIISQTLQEASMEIGASISNLVQDYFDQAPRA